MTTYHERGLVASFERALESAPELAASLIKVRKRIREYDPKVVDFVVQKQRNMTLEETYAFSIVWHWFNSGQFYLASIPVGSTPFSDNQLELNQKALTELPEKGFRTKVWCGSYECDGEFSWDFDIGLTSFVKSGKGTCDCGCKSSKRVPKVKTFAPASAPLEIGSTCASRSLLHLQQSRSLARWAYGHDEILLGVLDIPLESML